MKEIKIQQPTPKPGVCIEWEQKRKELPPIQGDEELFKRIWENNEALAYMYIWQVLLSF
ncbi:MAG: hypothetical protein JXA82_11275 [Sedimentisphaerales bacterium]|nr:hypothetical protein [Sedimentisphaerales bacterium]